MKRLLTKADRQAVQEAQFTFLTSKGYTRDTYKGLNIFVHSGELVLKVYRDTKSEAILWRRYQTADRLKAAIEEQKRSYDSTIEWREKNKKDKKRSTAANAAAAIREELKKTFPGIKFSVTSSNFSMGNSVEIRWEDGPTNDEVEAITSKYQYGRFNSMEDIYEYTNTREDIPQAKYVHERRDMSEATKKVLEPLRENFGHSGMRDEVERIFGNCSLPAGATVTGIVQTGKSAGLIEEVYTLSFEGQQKEFEKVEVPAGEVQVIQYSEKSIAVIGDTRPIKDKLRDLGGKFNFRLSCGPGWIFSKNKLSDLQKALS